MTNVIYDMGCDSYALSVTLLWVQIFDRQVIADTLLLDQDGRGWNSDQPVMDIPQAEKDV